MRGRRRVPENTLHALNLLGGWPGAIAARQLLRHKLRKPAFRRLFWLTAILHCALLGCLLWGVETCTGNLTHERSALPHSTENDCSHLGGHTSRRLHDGGRISATTYAFFTARSFGRVIEPVQYVVSDRRLLAAAYSIFRRCTTCITAGASSIMPPP